MQGLPPHLGHLLQAQAYPHPVGAIRLLETHISWLLLTGEFAYKLKRPVRLPFIDQDSAGRRAFLCAEEVRLNSRFAPELYLGVWDVTAQGIRPGGAAAGPVIEHAVRLRQFGAGQVLEDLLAAGAVDPPELARFGADLARIHATLPVVAPTQPWGDPAAIRVAMLENLGQCAGLAAGLGSAARLAALADPLRAALDALQGLCTERRREGRVRECHGDLHAGNVVRHGGRLLAFDCLEYEPAFRWIDVAEEVAFLLMDLEVRGRCEHGTAFLNGYLEQGGDHGLCRLLRLYGAHRALVRAKVAAIQASAAARPRPALARHHAYLAAAGRLLEAPRARMVLMHGLSGSGKTWLARRLALPLGAVLLRSDVERQRLQRAADGSGTPPPPGAGRYSPAATAAVYDHLLQCAADVLGGGRAVLVDATFLRRQERQRFAALAARLGVPLAVVACQAPRPLREQRVQARRGHDASEADAPVLDWQERHAQPLVEAGLPVIDADTRAPTVVTDVLRRLAPPPAATCAAADAPPG